MESKAKAPAASRKPKLASSHPTFYEMISDAIVALKERTGSSQYAITKYVEGKQKQLPNNFRKLLLFHLKRLVASGKLVKVKNSFKLPAGQKKSAGSPSKTNKTTTIKEKKTKADPKSKAEAFGKKSKASPGKKKAAAVVAKAKGSGKAKKAGAAMKAKKVTPMKNVKKPKSVKSPAKTKAKK